MEDAILIIGGDRAALKVAVKLRIQNPNKEVSVFIPSDVFPYRDFSISDFINMGIKDFQVFKQRIREYYKSQFNINIFINCSIKSIVPNERKIVVWDHKQKAELSYGYDTLVLATGSVPSYPSVEGISLDNVYFGDTSQEAVKILDWLDTGEVKQAVVIGGNLAGIQTAQALWEKDILVTLVEEREHILPEFDPEIAEMVCKHMMEKGVEVITGQQILTLIGNPNGEVVEVHTPEQILTCQIVIWMTKRKPDIELAEMAELPIKDGAIAVADDMETGIPGVYAVGACAGEKDLYNSALSTEIARVFDFYIAKTGISAKQAANAGYDSESVLVAGHDEPMYSYAAEEIIAILLADRRTRKLLGAQFLSKSPVRRFADFISGLIAKDGIIDDLTKVSSCSDSNEFMMLLANAMLDKIDNRYNTISPVALHKLEGDPNLIILDVRTEAEATISKIPYSLNIPIRSLEARKEELEKEKTIVIVAKGYTQGRQAYEILSSYGYNMLKILEGGIMGYPYELE